jgi:hypothetical protein
MKSLVQIMLANETAKLAEQGKKQFEKDSLESPEFRSLVDEIEDSALEGKTGFSKLLKNDEEVRIYEVFVNALIQAGYSSSIVSKTKFGILIPSDTNCEFRVSWKQEEKNKGGK